MNAEFKRLIAKLREIQRPGAESDVTVMCADAAELMLKMRAALELAEPALQSGNDALRAEAERYHAEMAGYRPHRHQDADDDCKSADIALQAVADALRGG